jgi:hypothetical protein
MVAVRLSHELHPLRAVMGPSLTVETPDRRLR